MIYLSTEFTHSVWLVLDIGIYKTGYVVSDASGNIIEHGIIYAKHNKGRKKVGEKRFFIETDDMNETIRSLIEKWGVGKVIVGNGIPFERVGTSGVEVEEVDETNSTRDAVAVFWKKHRVKGLRDWIGKLLGVVPGDYDDYAAMVILNRYRERVEK